MKPHHILPFMLILSVCIPANAQQAVDLLDNNFRSQGELDFNQLERFFEFKNRPYTGNTDIFRATDLEALVTSHTFKLSLPGEKPIVAHTIGTTRNLNGSISWVGVFNDDPMKVSLVVQRNSITGWIPVNGSEWEFHPLGGDYNVVTKLDRKFMLPDHPGATVNTQLGQVDLEATLATELVAAKSAVSSNIIDVLLFYTQGSSSNIENEVTHARDLARDALENSLIDVSVRIIHTVQASIQTEPPLDDCDLNPNCSINLFAAGTLVPEASALRTQYGADIVVLVSNGGGAKGVTRQIPAPSSLAYIMVEKDYLPSLTLGHEIGHVIGGNHNLAFFPPVTIPRLDPSRRGTAS